jgi:hypothetical protein
MCIKERNPTGKRMIIRKGIKQSENVHKGKQSNWKENDHKERNLTGKRMYIRERHPTGKRMSIRKGIQREGGGIRECAKGEGI